MIYLKIALSYWIFYRGCGNDNQHPTRHFEVESMGSKQNDRRENYGDFQLIVEDIGIMQSDLCHRRDGYVVILYPS